MVCSETSATFRHHARQAVSHESAQGKGIPCSNKKIPCSREKNSLFRPSQGIGMQLIEITNKFLVFAHAQGICRQRIEMTGGIGAKSPKWPRIRENSLLNSLFSGNLRLKADPFSAAQTAVKNGLDCFGVARLAMTSRSRHCEPKAKQSSVRRAIHPFIFIPGRERSSRTRNR